MKRIIICADGTWNRPEQLGKKQYPTNVLKFARGITAKDTDEIKQVVFYDWGIGSYHDQITGGGLGAGLEKNVMDGYRFLVHNYDPGDQIYLFGFSRGAYTVRSLCGLINNCSILKSAKGSLIEEAFAIYKNKKHKPGDAFSVAWKKRHAIQAAVNIEFVGVWDTVGAMGLPFSIFGLIKDKHLFYDRKIGSNVVRARHALCLDELRDDFEPTIWDHKEGVDLEQVWFAGVHSDVGGSYQPDKDGSSLADIPMLWILTEAEKSGLVFEKHVKKVTLNAGAKQHNEYKGKFRLLGKRQRKIPSPGDIPTWVHKSVKQRYKTGYKSKPIEAYTRAHGQWPPLWS